MRMNLNALTADATRESDSCGIYSWIEKTGTPSRAGKRIGLAALKALRHRAGYVGQEGDGSGLLVDIPRLLWKDFYQAVGRDSVEVDAPSFFVGHLFVEGAESQILPRIEAHLEECTRSHLIQKGLVKDDALGRIAATETPMFYQIAGRTRTGASDELFELSVKLRELNGVHVASLSYDHVVYKVVGDGDTLEEYFADLTNPLMESAVVMAHTRFSTNTRTSFSKVQPFQTIAHNGEINTIYRFFSESMMAGIELDERTSDSGMLDGFVGHLCGKLGWTLFEAMELLFPPVPSEVSRLSMDLKHLYQFYRALWGPFAQGPAGIMAVFGDEMVFSVDALGLRPLWCLETKDAYCFSSEQGIVPAELWVSEPVPLGPGEKVGIRFSTHGVTRLTHRQLQESVLRRARERFPALKNYKCTARAYPVTSESGSLHGRDFLPAEARAAAFGWSSEDVSLLSGMIASGKESIQSLGYDAPLAVLDKKLRLVSDFLQETVAVVTNPAIDREREAEHFSTSSLLGSRPSFKNNLSIPRHVELRMPILLEELPRLYEISRDELERVGQQFGTVICESVLQTLRSNAADTYELWIHREPEESTKEALLRLAEEAKIAAFAGAKVIVLNDRQSFVNGDFIDPILATRAVHSALFVPESTASEELIRRSTSLILRSASLRNLHDIAVAIGVGADAVVPYMMLEFAASDKGIAGIENLLYALTSGLEKVISTLGVHELRGYERLFSAIGLQADVARLLGVPNFCGGESVGFGFDDLDWESTLRKQLYMQTSEVTNTPRTFRLYPRIWKAAGEAAKDMESYQDFARRLKGFEESNPISIRHVLGFRQTNDESNPKEHDYNHALARVDLSVASHSLPFVICSMSFGSQNETAFRAYVKAAEELDMIALSGEGGEIPDLLEGFAKHRGRQVASGRFGVNAAFLNNAYVVEIKIGQGAKPGEGGHLPGSKVTAKVAQARSASLAVDLISPSNNHDIYSIEDLAQVIYEIKQVNPQANVAVKVPVVPNIGTIAVGIVKAGADIVSLSGFDGGTGAARAHAIRHVGLPVEIGISLVHRALSESGLREQVEIWADGGMKSGEDAMKAVLLGANRIGFGTMAMVAIGCTACRACHKDTCHVGIATQVEDMEEARHKGMTAFRPREMDTSVKRLIHFFRGVASHMAATLLEFGETQLQKLVGRSDLLVQERATTLFSVAELLVKPMAAEVILQTGVADRVATIQAQSSALVVGGEGFVDSTEAFRQTSTSYYGSETSIVTRDRRAIGLALSGDVTRQVRTLKPPLDPLDYNGVAGLGFAAYQVEGMTSRAHGGADDGVGKCASGGLISVLKKKCSDGHYRGGSVGKGLGYGAQDGVFVIQGMADTRAGIRLSGADVIIAGDSSRRSVHTQYGEQRMSSIKGFGFEYMTRGRGLVLGDPGPWLCSGMTGGSVYLEYDEPTGLTESFLRGRLAKGAKVQLSVLDDKGVKDVLELLAIYQQELRLSGQTLAVKRLARYMSKPREHFRMVRPSGQLTDQTIATE